LKFWRELIENPIQIFFSFNIIFLISCADHAPPEAYDPTTFALGEKGIVILRTTEDAPQIFKNPKVALPYILKKIGEEKVLSVSRNPNFVAAIYNPDNYDADMMMLDPGVYYIDSLNLNIGTQYRVRKYPGPGIKKIKSTVGNKYVVTIGAFEVRPGQVLYLVMLICAPWGIFRLISLMKLIKSKHI
jgi:hypothetical protein